MSLDTKAFINLVKESRKVSDEDLAAAVKAANYIGCPLTDVLVGRDLLKDDELVEILSRYYDVRSVNLNFQTIPQETLDIIPQELATSRNVLAFNAENGNLSIAMEDPGNLETIEFIKKTVGDKYNIVPFVTTSSSLKNALRVYKRNLQGEQATTAVVSNEEISVVATIDKLLDDSILQEASDIHIEALEDRLLVRFRIDGVLVDRAVFNKSAHDPIVARIKILSNLKLDETRLPQDGQFTHKTASGEIKSLRVSTVPSVFGEKVVLRILDSTQSRFGLEELGFLQEDQNLINKILEKSYGMFLMTGPTGSGKTTTLYTILGLLNKADTNIITIEDPVENKIHRVTQIQVNETVGLTFANGLRSILRQDPDVIMVGEIRDNETAVIAVNSAMTGHVVFSTVHANSAAGAIPRMIDLGIEPFLLASTLNIVVAQRLVRVLCPKCKTEVEINPLIKKKLAELRGVCSQEILSKVVRNFKSLGCQYCFKTGYKGRIGLFELLPINDQIRDQIVSKSTTNEIWTTAREHGVKSMIEDGFIKVMKGVTSIEEIFRVISS